MKNKQKSYLFMILAVALFLVACSKNTEPVSLTQIFNNNTFQTPGSYIFDNGKLVINKEFTLSKNPDVALGDIKIEENVQEIKKIIQVEFPKAAVSDNLFQTFETTLSKIKVEKSEKGIIFTGKDYEKRFDYLEGTQKMVKDELGIEYSVDDE